SAEVVIKKFKRAVTDSQQEIIYDQQSKKGISNLIEIYSCATGKGIKEVEKEFQGKGYGYFKLAVGETVADILKPIQKTYNELVEDKTYIKEIIKFNTETASKVSYKTLEKVKRKIGFISFK
ncbi:MAG: tryptophan--tRNA ligase, partial [Eubacteriaceae bacterium]